MTSIQVRGKERLIFLMTPLILIMMILGCSSEVLSVELPKKYAGMTLRYCEPENTAQMSLKWLIPQFEKETGIKVEIDLYDGATVRNKQVLDFTAHTAEYDVAFLQWWFVPEYARAGFLVPLDSYIEKMSVPGLLDVDDVYPLILKGLQVGGAQYGIPFYFLGGMLYYRADILDEYGWPVPATISDIETILDKFEAMKEQGEYERMSGWHGRGESGFEAFGSIAGFAWAYGAKLLDDVLKPTLISDPGWEQSLNTWVHFMRDHGPLGAATTTWWDNYNAFLQGQTLMLTETSDYGGDLTNPEISKVADKVGFAVAPKGPAGNHIQWFFAAGYGINNDISPEQKEAAWLFLQWRGSSQTLLKEAQLKTEARFDACSRKVQESSEYMEATRKAGLEEYVKAILEVNRGADPSYWPYIPEFHEIAEALTSQTSAVIGGTNTVKDALKNSDSVIYRVLKEAGYY